MTRHLTALFLGLALVGAVAVGCTTMTAHRHLPAGEAGPALPEQLPTVAAAPPVSPYSPMPAPAPLPAPLPAEAPPAKVVEKVVPELPPVPAPPKAAAPTVIRPVSMTTISAAPEPEPDPGMFPLQQPPTPPTEEPALLTALRLLLEKRPEEAIGKLMKYDKQTQDVLLPLLPLVARVSAGGLDRADPHELSLVMEQLDSTLAALRPRAPFVLERMCFCREVTGFGSYQPLPAEYTFRPGELVEVYVEPRWFSSQRQGQFYEVRLSGLLELRDGGGQVRWRQEFAERAADRSRSPRRDLHQSFRFCVPETLRRGQYTLLLTLTDTPTKRTAQRALELHVTTRPIGNP